MTYIAKSRNPLAPPKKPKPHYRTGKVYQTVRVSGPEMSKLRAAAYWDASGRCQLQLEGCTGYTPWKDGHLAHIKSRGAGGSDELRDANGNPQCVWSCPACHIRSHAYGVDGNKPVARKA